MVKARRWRTSIWAAVGFLVVVVAATGAVPPGPTPPNPTPPGLPIIPHGSVTVTILGIHATNQPTETIDPRLRSIASELRRSGYNSFRLVVNDTRSVSMSSTWELPLIEDYAIRIQPTKETDDKVNLILTWVRYEKIGPRTQARTLQRMSLEIRKGKYFPSGGWRLNEGALMAAIAVK
jgi:hypothetical protein